MQPKKYSPVCSLLLPLKAAVLINRVSPHIEHVVLTVAVVWIIRHEPKMGGHVILVSLWTTNEETTHAHGLLLHNTQGEGQ